MNLEYKGINNQGRAEWIDLEIGEVMEEWQVNRYRSFVYSVQDCIGRQLTKGELRTAYWLSGFEHR